MGLVFRIKLRKLRPSFKENRGSVTAGNASVTAGNYCNFKNGTLGSVQVHLVLSWNDYKNMEFTRCVINETLRLSNAAPFIPKEAIEDVRYNDDIVIPQGFLVVVHMCAVHLDPMVYDNPMEFNPWRWLDPSCDHKRKKSYMSFGGGARMCPGANLAMLEMVVLLHQIILNYEWEMVESAHDQPTFLPYLEYPKGLSIL